MVGCAVATAVLVAACATAPAVIRYPQSACTQYLHVKKEFTADIHWCARYVEIRGDQMEVQVSWEIMKLQGGPETVFQITDEFNPRMYLTDEIGRRYDHTRVSGAALGSRYQAGSAQRGSYFFPLPAAGARTFQFHDDENRAKLELRL